MQGAVLEQLPVALFRAFHEQTAGLMREYMLVVLGGSAQPFDLADVNRARSAKAVVASAVEAAIADTPPGNLPAAVTLTLDHSSVGVGAFGLLQGVLDHANRLAYTEEMLVLPVLPEVAALRNWICDEVAAQAAGASPTAWQLPAGVLEQPGVPLAVWDGLADLPADEAWLVGDDHNRVIGASQPALDLLGWTETEFIGQRILVVIPPHLRELHVAAFTRGLVTGHYQLLDQPLELTAHTRDGHDIDIVLRLQRYDASRGRCVFLARLEPR